MREQRVIGQTDLFDGPPPRFVKNPVGGYASRPGLGPAGETCRTCACARKVWITSGRGFWKCSIVRSTGGPGTDIRLKSPACSQWRAKPTEGR